jgi:phosphohistidine phosphatase SixA
VSGTLVHVIRHAEAGDRKRWTGSDEDRPLSKGGRRQAAGLAVRFAEEPFVQFLSSPFIRCVQTLEPLADASGLPVELRDELTEGRPWEYLEKLILEAEGEGPTAVCVHGDVFQGLMNDLFERGIGRAVAKGFKKGSTWVLEVRDGTIVGARDIPAPPLKLV